MSSGPPNSDRAKLEHRVDKQVELMERAAKERRTVLEAEKSIARTLFELHAAGFLFDARVVIYDDLTTHARHDHLTTMVAACSC